MYIWPGMTLWLPEFLTAINHYTKFKAFKPSKTF